MRLIVLPRCKMPLVQYPFRDSPASVQHLLQPSLANIWLIHLRTRIHKTSFASVQIKSLAKRFAEWTLITILVRRESYWWTRRNSWYCLHCCRNRSRWGWGCYFTSPSQLDAVLIVLGDRYNIIPRKFYRAPGAVDHFTGTCSFQFVEVTV